MLVSESFSILLDEEAGAGSSLLEFRLNLPDLSDCCATSEGRLPGNNCCCLGVKDVSERGLMHLLAPSPMFPTAAVVVTAPPTPPIPPTPPVTAVAVTAGAVAALVLLRVVPTSSFSSSSP